MDPTADLDGPALDFANCTYTVKVKQKGATGKSPRKLIANVSASIPSGVVLAVMGPSGAGKTTLLDMLMLERCGGVPEGVVTLGGHRLTLNLYMKHCAVVTQHDCLWWSLTVAEHISIALALYQPELTTSERIAYTTSSSTTWACARACTSKRATRFSRASRAARSAGCHSQ